MSQDMRKVSLGTHYMPLGSHSENKKDLTPRWVLQVQLIVWMVVSVLLLVDYTVNGLQANHYLLMLFNLVIGLSFLPQIIFNWRQGVRYFDLVLAILLISSSLYFFFK